MVAHALRSSWRYSVICYGPGRYRDIALWGLKAKLAGEPLWRFLGGHNNTVSAYAGGIDLQLSMDNLREQTHQNLESGFRAIKMKAGRDRLTEDVARVESMRDLLGSEIPQMVDANMRWTTDQSIKASHAFAQYDVYWLEEPTVPDDVEGQVRILREGALPVATGENLHTIYEFQKMVVAGAVSYPEPDVSNCGGITPWLKIAHMADAFNLPVTTHGIHDSHVHLLAAIPNVSYREAHGFGLEKFIYEPVEIADGFATASDRPGRGVNFDWDGLKSYRG